MNIFCPDPCVTCAPNPAGSEGIFPNPNAEANPFSNFSSEKPDTNIFIGNRPGGPGDPPIGPWLATGCIGICFSTASQAAADICAYNQKVICDRFDWPVDLCVLFPSDPSCLFPNPATPPVPRPIFSNDQQSCTVNCPDGTPFGLVVLAGTFPAFSKAAANDIARSYACNEALLRRTCLSALSPTACCTQQFYFGDINVSGAATGPFTFVVESGFLPIGMNLQQTGPTSARISGTPTTTGTFSFAIRATDATTSIIRQYTTKIVGITTAALPDGEVGTPYSQTLAAQPLPVDPVWSVVSGTLPSGLTLNAGSGEISGTPTMEQVSSFTIHLATLGLICSKNYTLNIEATEACPDFDAVVWTPSTSSTGPPATVTLSAVGGSIVGTSSVTDEETQDASYQAVGDFNYHGPGCDCNLHFDSTMIDSGSGQAGCQMQIFNVTDAVVVVNQITFTTQIVDFPFSMPDTLGINKQFQIQISGGCGSQTPPPGPAQGDISILFTNVP